MLVKYLSSEANSASGYASWKQVGGYFDGDGSVTVHLNKITLDFDLQFVDNYRPQLEQLRNFLEINGARPGSICKNVREMMYVLEIHNDASVLKIAKALLPFCSKKKLELKTVIDYMGDRITADTAIGVFNHLVTSGERTGKIRKVDMPYFRTQALKECSRRCGEATRKKMSKLTLELQSEIQRRHLAGETARNMAADYKVSERTIVKAIHGGYKQ